MHKKISYLYFIGCIATNHVFVHYCLNYKITYCHAIIIWYIRASGIGVVGGSGAAATV
jgi:pantothenate kinase